MDIFITEVISNTTVNRVLQEIITKKDNDKKKDIMVYIDSQGGGLESGYALYEILKLSGRKIITYAINECFSCAVTVFLAGEERYATNYSNFMVHEPYHEHEHDEETSIAMTTTAYRKYLKELQGATNEYFKLISKHTTLTPQRIKKYIQKTESGDWYFRSSLAKKLGFVTKIGIPF